MMFVLTKFALFSVLVLQPLVLEAQPLDRLDDNAITALLETTRVLFDPLTGVGRQQIEVIKTEVLNRVKNLTDAALAKLPQIINHTFIDIDRLEQQALASNLNVDSCRCHGNLARTVAKDIVTKAVACKNNVLMSVDDAIRDMLPSLQDVQDEVHEFTHDFLRSDNPFSKERLDLQAFDLSLHVRLAEYLAKGTSAIAEHSGAIVRCTDAVAECLDKHLVPRLMDTLRCFTNVQHGN